MTLEDKREGRELEYERFPGQADIRVSTIQTTPRGEKIRAVVTTGNSILFTGVGQATGDTLIVTGEPGSDLTVFRGFWDTVRDTVAGLVGELVKNGGGGGGQKCTTTTQVNVGKDGKVTGVTTTTTCAPA